MVYLTFDDGPSETYTPRILDVLAHHGATATFFVVGNRVARHPDLVRQELAAGNAVGNHSWNHTRLTTLSSSQTRNQLRTTSSEIRSLGGTARCYRPPYGAADATVHAAARELGLREYLWTTESKDWEHGTASTILRRASAGLAPGAILVFHDGSGSGSSESIAAVTALLDLLHAKGFDTAPLPC